MKKYNKPEARIIVIKTQRMIAESVGFNATPVAANEAESRGGRSTSWDDED